MNNRTFLVDPAPGTKKATFILSRESSTRTSTSFSIHFFTEGAKLPDHIDHTQRASLAFDVEHTAGFKIVALCKGANLNDPKKIQSFVTTGDNPPDSVLAPHQQLRLSRPGPDSLLLLYTLDGQLFVRFAGRETDLTLPLPAADLCVPFRTDRPLQLIHGLWGVPERADLSEDVTHALQDRHTAHGRVVVRSLRAAFGDPAFTYRKTLVAILRGAVRADEARAMLLRHYTRPDRLSPGDERRVPDARCEPCRQAVLRGHVHFSPCASVVTPAWAHELARAHGDLLDELSPEPSARSRPGTPLPVWAEVAAGAHEGDVGWLALCGEGDPVCLPDLAHLWCFPLIPQPDAVSSPSTDNLRSLIAARSLAPEPYQGGPQPVTVLLALYGNLRQPCRAAPPSGETTLVDVTDKLVAALCASATTPQHTLSGRSMNDALGCDPWVGHRKALLVVFHLQARGYFYDVYEERGGEVILPREERMRHLEGLDTPWTDAAALSTCLDPACASGSVVQNPVFGIALSELMERPENTDVPHLLYTAFQYLGQSALQSKAVFALVPDAEELATAQHRVAQQGTACDLAAYRVEVIVGLVKAFFRELPEPLIAATLRPAFASVFADYPADEQRTERFHAIWTHVRQLMPCNLRTLRFVVQELHRFTEFAEWNQMSARALSLIFGPLFFQLDGTVPQAMQGQLCAVVQLLIVHPDYFFEGVET
eukprot:gnl/Trimastix_PCT/3370.p1 GENE.gnl/Trimastix_PCT/3370~~gnl/Trimastix_PCT/3370.p1  ORF type:complete len:770 (-),score=229.50 gnl/Trimastix_PCT/3370:82-2208(-)